MEQSEKIDLLATALVKFQSEVKNITKEGDNSFFHSKYATLKNTLTTTRPTLTKYGLAVSQFPTGEDSLTSILMHESGQWIKSTVKMSPKKDHSPGEVNGIKTFTQVSPQSLGSAITYMRRYAFSSILGIATEDEDDGNQASKSKKEISKVDMVKIEKMINASKSIEILVDIDEKIKQSKLYKSDEKKKVEGFIKKRIESIEAESQKQA